MLLITYHIQAGGSHANWRAPLDIAKLKANSPNIFPVFWDDGFKHWKLGNLRDTVE